MGLPRRWLTLAIVSAALFLVVIDMTVLYTALPSLAQALHTTASEKLWILNAYSLVMAALMPVMGALGDRWGHRRVFLCGMVAFGLASMVAAFAPSAQVLIAARALLAVGGAAMMPATIAIVRTSFPDPKELALAIGIWASIASGGAAVGPLLGGALLTHFWWGSVFLINVPIIAVAALLALRYVPVRAGNPSITLDLPSCVLSMVGIIALAYGIKALAQPNHTQWLAASILAVGVGTLWAFVLRQLRIPNPLIDLRVLGAKPIASGMLVALLASMTLIGFELVLSQRLQLVDGKSPLQAGAFVLPISLGSFIAGPLAGAIVGRWGSVRVIVLGLGMTAGGILGYALLRHHASVWPQIATLALCGLGIGSSLTASSTLVMRNVSEARAGMVGAVEGVAYEFGGGFGVTIFGSIMTAVYISQTERMGLSHMAGSTLDEAHTFAQTSPLPEAAQWLADAMQAFEGAFAAVVAVVVALQLCLLALVWLRHRRQLDL